MSGTTGKDFDISVGELNDRIEKGSAPFLLDVREPLEVKIVSIGGYHIPLRELPSRLGELSAGQEIVVYCHHGIRSRLAVQFLREAGFEQARNLAGGIDAWSREIDPTKPVY